jgi:SAM-dependent methyltransferase
MMQSAYITDATVDGIFWPNLRMKLMDQWTRIIQNFDQYASPLRPSQEDVSLYKAQLKPDDRVLLLGITSELIPLATVLVDHNPKLIEQLQSPQAVLGDWSDLPFQSEFDAVIGDGVLTVFQGTLVHFFEQVRKVLRKGGSMTLRLYISPETKEDYEDVLRTKKKTGFHAFKWRVAQVLANPYIRVKDLYNAVLPVWDHPTLQFYQDSDLVYYFPKLSELPAYDQIQFPSSYDLAERCPVVTWRNYIQTT